MRFSGGRLTSGKMRREDRVRETWSLLRLIASSLVSSMPQCRLSAFDRRAGPGATSDYYLLLSQADSVGLVPSLPLRALP